MKKLIIILCLIPILASAQWKTYHIRQGKHNCDESRPFQRTGYYQKIQFQFTPSAVYNEAEQTHTGWNKLWGWGDLWGRYSNRIGWKCYNNSNSFPLSMYLHLNGQYYAYPFDTVQYNKIYYAEIYWETNQYKIKVIHPDGVIKSVSYPQPTKPSSRQYQLYPYFGGKEVAPHNMDFLINKTQ